MIERYTLPEMGRVWSDQHKYELWCRVETLVLEAHAAAGRVPADVVEPVRNAPPPTPERVAEIEETTQHDVIAFLTAWADNTEPRSAAAYVHHGMTSSDLLDTALAVQLTDATDVLLAKADRLVAALRDHGAGAPRHDQGRAHARRARRARRVGAPGRRPRLRRRPVAGPAAGGARAGRRRRHLRRRRHVLADRPVGRGSTSPTALGLRPADASTQVVIRDSISEWVSALAIIATVCEAVALEVRHGQRTEVRELSEAFGSGQKGSSAMPHKKNPIRSERIAGLARVVRAAIVPVMEGIPLWHERDISHSSTERVFLPDAAITTDYLLHLTAGLVENLVVDADRMRANLESTGGLIYTSSVLLELVEGGLSREDAYALVQARGDGDVEVGHAVPGDAADAGGGRRRDARRGAAGRDLPAGALRGQPRPAVRPARGALVSLDLPLVARGKVREIYDAGSDRLLLVASDRISAYDHVLPTPIPDKGRVLTAAVGVVVRAADAGAVVVRGDAPPDLRRPTCPRRDGRPGDARAPAGDAAGRVRGPRLPVGVGHGRVPSAPARSATSPCPPGWSRARGCRRRCSRRRPRRRWASTTRRSTSPPWWPPVGAARAEELRELTLALYARAAEIAREAGIILADTKFEFGVDAGRRAGARRRGADPRLVALLAGRRPGRRASAQPSYDKQFVRDWLTSSGWDRVSPPPELPADVVAATRERYVTAYEQLTGRTFT